MCVYVASNGRGGGGHDKKGVSLLGIYVSANQPVNAAHLDCEAYGNNVIKLAESFPDRNHINCTMTTGLQTINCSSKKCKNIT